MEIKRDFTFDSFANDERSFVFELIPDVYKDGRGSFSEVVKDHGKWLENSKYPLWFSNMEWMRQVNRSKSSSSVVRGCHAQRGIYCQGKLVEAVNNIIFDIITDARPDSETFGVSKAYRLDNARQNKIWVPRGFLHSFATPNTIDGDEAIFMYYVDNVYNKDSEICVNPMTVLPDVVESLEELADGNETIRSEFQPLIDVFKNKEGIIFSEKDLKGMDYPEFVVQIKNDYDRGKTWYR